MSNLFVVILLDWALSIQAKKFDVAILMGCLGFIDDEFDISILKSVVSVLKKGSILILELENRDWTIRNFQSCTHHQFEGLEVFEEWKFDSQSSISYSVSRFYKKDSDTLNPLLELRTHLRLYSLHEVIRILECAGLSYLKSFDNILRLEPLQHQSEDMVVVARK